MFSYFNEIEISEVVTSELDEVEELDEMEDEEEEEEYDGWGCNQPEYYRDTFGRVHEARSNRTRHNGW